MIGAKKQASQAKTSPPPTARSLQSPDAVAPRHGKSIKIIAAVLILAIIAFIVIVLYVRATVAALHPPNVTVESGAIHSAIAPILSGILTYNFSSNLVPYARARYDFTNSSAANLSLTLYSSNPIMRIYLVDPQGYCEQCYITSELYVRLNSSLHQYGLLFNSSSLTYVSINNVSSIKANSIVVIPSGLMPSILLPSVTSSEGCPSYSNTTILDLLTRGDVIMYVGRNLSRSVSCSGQIVQDSNQTLSDIGSIANITSPFNVTSNPLHLNNPTFAFTPGIPYGTATATVYYEGTFIALSNYPTIGWSGNVSALASDIAKTLASRFWIGKVAYGIEPLSSLPSGNATIFAINKTISNQPQAQKTISGAYGLLSANVSNSDNFQDYSIPLSYSYSENGLVSMQGVVSQTVQTQISSQIFNGSRSRVSSAYISILYQNLTPVPQNPIQVGQVESSAVYTYPTFSFPGGYYVAELKNSEGSLYSSALFQMATPVITPTSINFNNDTFIFSVTSNNQTVNGAPYSINVNGAYNSTGTVDQGVINYTIPRGIAISHGTVTFNVEMFGSQFPVTYQYVSTSTPIPPLYIAFAIAAVVILVLNKVLVPPNTDEYYIDVPELNPAERQKAKETPEAIVAVFDKVNEFYHWKYTPLTAEEIRSGISNNIKYGNARMSITLRNTYAILNGLLVKGLVATSLNYYAPQEWTRKSGHSIDYLVMYRKLRDYCIANAALFTEVGMSSKADIIVTNKGTQSFIKIYSEDMSTKEIAVTNRARTFILFIDDEKKLTFLDSLYRSYGRNAELLKMAINYGNVKLIECDNLDELML